MYCADESETLIALVSYLNFRANFNMFGIRQKNKYLVLYARYFCAELNEERASHELVRASKVLSERGVCSRREADEYIRKGLVAVDGTVITELGTKVLRNQEITLLKEASCLQNSLKTILLNKPEGFVSSPDDKRKYKLASSLITADNFYVQGGGGGDDRLKLLGQEGTNFVLYRGLAPAGRLDFNSTGLLVLTQDGRVSKELIGPDNEIEKEYLVAVKGEITSHGLSLLRSGLELDGKKLKPARVKCDRDDVLRIILREGRKRQIRRMCELVGLKVVTLKRIRIGRISLSGLPIGKWRFMSSHEMFR